MTGRLIVVGCGGRKLDHPDQPARLYTGPYFTACLDAAMAMRARWPGRDDRIMILSAKYGLLHLWSPVIEPYELRLGQHGAISAKAVYDQAAREGYGRRPVVALCGKAYAGLCRHVWHEVTAPLAGLGIGQQLHVLKGITATGTYPGEDTPS